MHALPLDDPKWASLQGGYRVPYDASVPIKSFLAGAKPAPVWEELWNELHHQGDVGEASYASLPSLVEICISRKLYDWNLFALASTIESCRAESDNPRLPTWLKPSYQAAWDSLFEFGLEALRKSDDKLLVQSVLGVVALQKGLNQLGRILSELDESEIEELYEQHFGES